MKKKKRLSLLEKQAEDFLKRFYNWQPFNVKGCKKAN